MSIMNATPQSFNHFFLKSEYDNIENWLAKLNMLNLLTIFYKLEVTIENKEILSFWDILNRSDFKQKQIKKS